MRNPLRLIQEKPFVVTVILTTSGFILGAFADFAAEQWMDAHVEKSSSGAMLIIVILLFVLLVLISAAVDLMLRLNRKVGIKVRYYEKDSIGKVYIACQRLVERAQKSIDVLNSFLIEAHDSSGSSRAREERKKYYTALIDRARKHEVKYRRIMQVRSDRSNLDDLKDDPLLEEHLRAMLNHTHSRHIGNMSLVECSPSRMTTFVLIDGEHLVWQINEVQTDSSGKERLNLQGAFIFHDPQRRITPHFKEYFEKLWDSHKGKLRLDAPRAKKGVGTRQQKGGGRARPGNSDDPA